LTKSDLLILVAIPYMKKAVADQLSEYGNTKLFLDSGAFTYWNLKKEFSLSQYSDFISNLKIKPWKYFSLDVVGDPKKTMSNYKELLKLGLKPIPIFQRGAELKDLEKYFTSSDLVAIGGLVGSSHKRNFVKGILEASAGRNLHLLGFAQRDFLKKYRPFSVDCSTWNNPHKYGHIILYMGNSKWKTLNRKDFIKKPDKEILDSFNLYEEDPRRFAFSENWSGSSSSGNALLRMGAKSWIRYQMEIKKALNVNLFIVAGSSTDIKALQGAHCFWSRKLK
jgi:hypothetical protein